ncbi:hypothetical protein [Methylopila sp. Yamaguchi]|uniref:hypothetical protein n=1 Tax=Methylopila sp. Yamaguchi TaxID=1437817 RepID=UPI0011AF73FF|nr:hypothetical protein [Methylopila sp. Yamaguchi]
MKFVGAAGIAACVVLLGGCAAAVDPKTFAAGREVLIGSPAAMRHVTAECAAKVRRNPQLHQSINLLVNLPSERSPDVFCERFIKAYRDGRISYEKYLESSKKIVDPDLVRIAQGR